MNLWKQLIKDDNNDFYIILEDDIKLVENFNEKLKICCEEFVNNNMELLFIGSYFINKKKNEDINNLQFIYTNKLTETQCNFGYILSKTAAIKNIKYIKENGIKYAIDVPIIYSFLTSVNFINEHLVYHDFSFSNSDIQRHTHYFNFD
jgi:GR25 family glycosyltransferase involved in LPS biosynthesis